LRFSLFAQAAVPEAQLAAKKEKRFVFSYAGALTRAAGGAGIFLDLFVVRVGSFGLAKQLDGLPIRYGIAKVDSTREYVSELLKRRTQSLTRSTS